MIARARAKIPWNRYTPVITWTVILACLLLGLGMTVQPQRFARTPSYANLIDLAPAQAWGGAYLLVAVLLCAWRLLAGRGLNHRTIGAFAHAAATLLLVWWLGAFIIRWITDDKTTIVNVVSWGVLISLVIRSMWGLDDDPEQAEHNAEAPQ